MIDDDDVSPIIEWLANIDNGDDSTCEGDDCDNNGDDTTCEGDDCDNNGDDTCEGEDCDGTNIEDDFDEWVQSQEVRHSLY